MFVRRLLRISDRPRQVSESAAQKSFQRSMFISAVRCTLTYVVFPFVAPAIGFATGVAGAALGPIIFGLAYDNLGGYNAAIVGLLALPVFAAIAVLLTRPPDLGLPPVRAMPPG